MHGAAVAAELCVVFPDDLVPRVGPELGNETVVGYDFSVDNIAPVADLDPPNLRDTKLDRVLRCSHEFDPLGNNVYDGDMPNDRTMRAAGVRPARAHRGRR